MSTEQISVIVPENPVLECRKLRRRLRDGPGRAHLVGLGERASERPLSRAERARNSRSSGTRCTAIVSNRRVYLRFVSTARREMQWGDTNADAFPSVGSSP